MKAEEVFQRFLEKGETILWIGRPGPGRTLTPAEVRHLVYLGLITVGLGIVGFDLLPRAAEGSLAGAVVLFLMLAAVEAASAFVFAGSVVRSFRRRTVMLYGLTTDRAIIVEAGQKPHWAWVRLAEDTPIAVTEYGGGRGSISIGRRYDFDTEEWPLFRGFTFYNVKNVDQVRRILDRLQDGYHVNRAKGSGRDGGVDRSASLVAPPPRRR
ncbi:MAG: hypothetical protein K2Q06_02255 [Parvularculaceae bacterium]|nr:hypothetical protein [Parvularculaceae bacterium]